MKTGQQQQDNQCDHRGLNGDVTVLCTKKDKDPSIFRDGGQGKEQKKIMKSQKVQKCSQILQESLRFERALVWALKGSVIDQE